MEYCRIINNTYNCCLINNSTFRRVTDIIIIIFGAMKSACSFLKNEVPE